MRPSRKGGDAPESSSSTNQLRNREYARKTRQRKNANSIAMGERFVELQNELEYLRAVVQENSAAKMLLKLYAKESSGESAATHDVVQPNLNFSSTLLSLHQVPITPGISTSASSGSSSSSVSQSDAILSSAVTGLDDPLISSIMSIDNASKVNLDPDDAFEQLNVLSMSSLIPDDTNELLQILTHRRYAMPTEVGTLGHIDKDDSEALLLFKKERNRLHAKLTRDRKRLVKTKLEQVIENLEETIKNMRAGLSLANVNLPAFCKTDLGVPSTIIDGSASTADSTGDPSDTDLPLKQMKTSF